MSVASNAPRVTYAGDGSSTTFAYSHYFLAQASLLVLGIDSSGTVTTYVLSSDYTVSGTAAANGTYPNGGSVVFADAPLTGITISIINTTDLLQSSTWVDNDPDPATVKETAFDKLTLEVQRLNDLVSRSVRLVDGFAATFDPTLPVLLPPGEVLTVNSTGTGWASDTISTEFVIANNQSSPADVTGLLFTGSDTQSFFLEYFIYRKTTSTGATELASRGVAIGAFSPVANSWEMSVGPQVGDAGVTLSITSAGQIQYTSTNITGTASVSGMLISYRTLGVVT